jgi:hypothetical protein
MASITIAYSYYVADAAVETNILGSSADHQEDVAPVEAYAEVSGEESTALAYANANMLTVNTLAYVEVLPDPHWFHVGFSAATSLDILLELMSDTTWMLDLTTTYSTDQSSNGATEVGAMATVYDMVGSEIYSYDLSIHGPSDSHIFGAGTYDVVFAGWSFAFAGTEPLGSHEFAGSTVEMTAILAVIPAPSAILLSGIGMTTLGWLRRRRIL